MNGLKNWLIKAREEKFALGAFNLDSFETLKAVRLAAKRLNSPVLVEVSPGEVEYLGIRNIASLVDNARREFGIPLFLNLDHATDLDLIKESLNFGVDLIHYDGSKLPLEDNINNAKQVVSWAHAKNILVEGEIDHFPGSSELHTQESIKGQVLSPPAGEAGIKYTDIGLAQRFVQETGVDIFAVFVGNKHGVYLDGSEKLDLGYLQKLREALPNTFFSLHGGSGIPAEDIQAAIKLGVVKVNINTELRIAWRKSLTESLANNPNEYTWSRIAQKAIEEVQKVTEDKIKLFGPTV